jgi:3-deoxy-D-manno-octulosonic-acid transferase
MTVFYNLIFLIYAIFYFPLLLIKGKWHRGFFARLGFLPKDFYVPFKGKKNIWIHAVSVGEVLAVMGLIQKIKQALPTYQIVLSTVTKTGYKIAQDKIGNEVLLIYAPLDFSWATNRFVRAIDPAMYVLAETEIWPNLFTSLANNNVPIIQINGRISDKAFAWYKRVRFLLEPVLEHVAVFCMQSDDDADKIRGLGAAHERVNVVGNVKFDNAYEQKPFDKTKLGYAQNDFVFVAGSTHPGEERALLEILNSLRESYPSLRLLIAPRHIDRIQEIEGIIREIGFNPKKFSQLQEAINPHDVVIVDTIGHLQSLYQIASLVFVGKSLKGWGGQNILEPAYFGKAIIVGPNMQNFRHVLRLFLQDFALVQVKDQRALLIAVQDLLNGPHQLAVLGAAAKNVVAKNKGATDRTYQIIQDNLSSK